MKKRKFIFCLVFVIIAMLSANTGAMAEIELNQGAKSEGYSKRITRTIYVDCNAQGENNGSTWENAYNNLQDAIDAAYYGDSIWMAAGIYKPTKDMNGDAKPKDDRDKTFMLKDGVSVYGGFEGNESPDGFDLNSRDLVNNRTVLSGDLKGDNNVKTEGINDEILRQELSEALGLYAFILDESMDNESLQKQFEKLKDEADSTLLSQHEYMAIMDAFKHLDPDKLLKSLESGFVIGLQDEVKKDVYSIIKGYVLYKTGYDGSAGLMYSDILKLALDLASSFEGDDKANVNWKDDCYTIITGVDTGNSIVMDGFTVSGGAGFTKNSDLSFSDFYAGGITLIKSSPVISNCSFEDNLGTCGASICNVFSSPSILNCTFSGSFVEPMGGAVFNYVNSLPVIKGCEFTNNFTKGYGAGISSFAGGAIIEDCVFSGNTASLGGAVSYVYDSNSEGMLLAFMGSEFFGITMEPAYSKISNCIFESNTSLDKGAAIYVEGDIPLSIENSVFVSNPSFKGVIYLDNSDKVNITNCTLSGNYAAAKNTSGNPIILRGENSNVVINNSILWGNGSKDGQIEFINGGTAEVNYSCIEGGWQGPGVKNIDSNPVFVEDVQTLKASKNKQANLRLDVTSPCIDAGSNSLAPIGTGDLYGNSRRIDMEVAEDTGEGEAPVIDMGACEAVDFPPAPTNLRVENTPGGGVTLSWTASESKVGIMEYEIYRIEGVSCGSDGEIAEGKMELIGSTGDLRFTEEERKQGTEYGYAVRARDILGSLSLYSDLYLQTLRIHAPESISMHLNETSTMECSITGGSGKFLFVDIDYDNGTKKNCVIINKEIFSGTIGIDANSKYTLYTGSDTAYMEYDKGSTVSVSKYEDRHIKSRLKYDEEGEYSITIKAADENGNTTEKVIEVKVRPEKKRRETSSLSSNANLSGFSVSEGSITPAFDPEHTSYSYTADPDTSVSFKINAEDNNASIIIEVTDADDGSQYLYEELGSGGTTAEKRYGQIYEAIIKVTAQNGMEKVYTLNIEVQ